MSFALVEGAPSLSSTEIRLSLFLLSNELNVISLEKCVFVFRTPQILNRSRWKRTKIVEKVLQTFKVIEQPRHPSLSTTGEPSSMLGTQDACSKNQVVIN